MTRTSRRSPADPNTPPPTPDGIQDADIVEEEGDPNAPAATSTAARKYTPHPNWKGLQIPLIPVQSLKETTQRRVLPHDPDLFALVLHVKYYAGLFKVRVPDVWLPISTTIDEIAGLYGPTFAATSGYPSDMIGTEYVVELVRRSDKHEGISDTITKRSHTVDPTHCPIRVWEFDPPSNGTQIPEMLMDHMRWRRENKGRTCLPPDIEADPGDYLPEDVDFIDGPGAGGSGGGRGGGAGDRDHDDDRDGRGGGGRGGRGGRDDDRDGRGGGRGRGRDDDPPEYDEKTKHAYLDGTWKHAPNGVMYSESMRRWIVAPPSTGPNASPLQLMPPRPKQAPQDPSYYFLDGTWTKCPHGVEFIGDRWVAMPEPPPAPVATKAAGVLDALGGAAVVLPALGTGAVTVLKEMFDSARAAREAEVKRAQIEADRIRDERKEAEDRRREADERRREDDRRREDAIREERRLDEQRKREEEKERREEERRKDDQRREDAKREEERRRDDAKRDEDRRRDEERARRDEDAKREDRRRDEDRFARERDDARRAEEAKRIAEQLAALRASGNADPITALLTGVTKIKKAGEALGLSEESGGESLFGVLKEYKGAAEFGAKALADFAASKLEEAKRPAPAPPPPQPIPAPAPPALPPPPPAAEIPSHVAAPPPAGNVWVDGFGWMSQAEIQRRLVASASMPAPPPPAPADGTGVPDEPEWGGAFQYPAVSTDTAAPEDVPVPEVRNTDEIGVRDLAEPATAPDDSTTPPPVADAPAPYEEPGLDIVVPDGTAPAV